MRAAGELFAAISAVGKELSPRPIAKTYRQDLADRLAAGQTVEACLLPKAEIGSEALFEHSNEGAASTTIAAAFFDPVRRPLPFT